MEDPNAPSDIQKEKKQLKQIRHSIYALLFALVAVSASFALIIKLGQEDLKVKDIKISSLISEVGQVKDDLNSSVLTIDLLMKDLEKANHTISNLNDSVVRAAAAKETDWLSLQSELTTTRENLNGILAQKEQLINDLSQKNETLKKEMNVTELSPDILDVLILGHNYGLVDTIMLASANPATNKIHLISIPRDLYHKGRKINELYEAYGINELEKAVYEITNIYPDKYILFGMDSFVDFIDMLGGIRIDVKKALIDYSYPGPENSYVTVSFDAGIQIMDGQTALKYARSRKSTSDFDRGLRQQQIISAVKDKALEMDLLSKLDLATKIYAKVSSNLDTDIGFFDALGYLQTYRGYSLNTGNVLNTSNYLYSTKNAKGQYILLPINDSYYEIKNFLADLILN